MRAIFNTVVFVRFLSIYSLRKENVQKSLQVDTGYVTVSPQRSYICLYYCSIQNSYFLRSLSLSFLKKINCAIFLTCDIVCVSVPWGGVPMGFTHQPAGGQEMRWQAAGQLLQEPELLCRHQPRTGGRQQQRFSGQQRRRWRQRGQESNSHHQPTGFSQSKFTHLIG